MEGIGVKFFLREVKLRGNPEGGEGGNSMEHKEGLFIGGPPMSTSPPDNEQHLPGCFSGVSPTFLSLHRHEIQSENAFLYFPFEHTSMLFFFKGFFFHFVFSYLQIFFNRNISTNRLGLMDMNKNCITSSYLDFYVLPLYFSSALHRESHRD